MDQCCLDFHVYCSFHFNVIDGSLHSEMWNETEVGSPRFARATHLCGPTWVNEADVGGG